MSAPKLLIVTTVPQTLATILRDQPRFLSQQFDVTLATSPGDEVAAVARNEQRPVELVPMARGVNPIADLTSIARMVRLIRRLRPDAVHAYTPKAGLVTMVAAALCRVPVRIFTFTGVMFPFHSGFKRWLLIWLDRLITSFATCVVPEGEGVKRELLKFAITNKPLEVIGHGNIAGVDTDFFDPYSGGVEEASERLAVQLGLGVDDRIFCFIGRLSREKGLFELAQAFLTLPRSARLLIVGALDERAPIDAHALSILDHPRIHRLGFHNDVRPALAASDVLVLPSYREGFPNVMLQAAAMRLPVIATDICGCNEFVVPGVNGWLVEPRDAEALAAAMREALALPADALKAMGEAGRRRVKERHERRAFWDSLRRFYEAELGPRTCRTT